MADAGGKTVTEKKSWADVEEEEEAKAKAKAAEAEAAAAAAGSSSKTEPAVEAQAKQIEALSLAAPEEDGGAEGPPLLDDSDDSQIQAVRFCPHTCRRQPLALAYLRSRLVD
jgi:ATP-dependent RNA helicase DDX19/DBP5